MLRATAALALLALASCTPEQAVVYDPGSFEPIAGIEPGQSADDVAKKLGKPDARATGWWSSTNRFDQNSIVWYYKDKGRVVIDGYVSRTVVTSEADPSEDGRP
jgi:outer membrane protein assembly factor BamE (lipoprotein component of BamABCDE complex)